MKERIYLAPPSDGGDSGPLKSLYTRPSLSFAGGDGVLLTSLWLLVVSQMSHTPSRRISSAGTPLTISDSRASFLGPACPSRLCHRAVTLPSSLLAALHACGAPSSTGAALRT